MSLLSECLVGVTGLLPKRVDASDVQKAHELPGKLAKRLRAWLGAPMKPFEYREPPADMEKLFTQLYDKPGQVQTQAWFEGIGVDDPDLPADFLSGLIECRTYLVGDLLAQPPAPGIWPTLTIDTAAGPEPLPLSVDDAGDMAAVFAVLNDPSALLDEIEQYTLEPLQATAFRECYPALYDHLGQALQAAIAEKRAKDKEWLPSWQQEGVMRTLKGMPPEAQFTAPPPPAPPNPKLELNSEAQATQGQLAEQPVGRENPTGAGT